MKYKYTWQETGTTDPSFIAEAANAHIVINTNSGDVILEENYVPLMDLLNKLNLWNIVGRFEYSPDGYEENPLICFETINEVIHVDSPDIRAESRSVEISKSEFIEFRKNLSHDVRKDVDDMLAT